MIKVLKSGFYSTIQDLGRLDFENYGVPVSGVMDQFSATLANSLLGNHKNDAVLEITMSGPNLKFTCDTCICVTGADLSTLVNNKPIKLNRVIVINSGDILSFGRLNFGFRSYLAVSGGFQSELVMNSRSMYSGITKQGCIERNDSLSINPNKTYTIPNSVVKTKASHFSSEVIEVFKGPEFELLNSDHQELFLSKTFTISKHNSRMAYQLEETLDNSLEPIITSLVLPGTVQLTPSGKLIVLMRDCQTTGGYPRVLQLKESSINILSQKFTNAKVKFKLVD